MYRKNTAGQFICVQLILTATGAVGTGLTPAARRCLDGTFAAGTGTYTEDGTTGSYKFALSQADTNANNVSIITTATGCIPVCVNFVTTAADPTNATTFGLTNLDAAISTRASQTSLDTVDDFVDTEVAAIKTQTDKLTFTVANVLDCNMLRINGDATSAANIAKTTRAIGRGTATTAGSSTTLIATSAFLPVGVAANADQFAGRVVTFDADTTTTKLRGQSTSITSSTAAAAPVFTVVAITIAPVDGDTFSVT